MTAAISASSVISARTFFSNSPPASLWHDPAECLQDATDLVSSASEMPSSWLRAPSSAFASMALRPLTRTSRYHPARTKCASPSASLASVLFTFMSSAFFACRASFARLIKHVKFGLFH